MISNTEIVDTEKISPKTFFIAEENNRIFMIYSELRFFVVKILTKKRIFNYRMLTRRDNLHTQINDASLTGFWGEMSRY